MTSYMFFTHSIKYIFSNYAIKCQLTLLRVKIFFCPFSMFIVTMFIQAKEPQVIMFSHWGGGWHNSTHLYFFLLGFSNIRQSFWDGTIVFISLINLFKVIIAIQLQRKYNPQSMKLILCVCIKWEQFKVFRKCFLN